MSGQPRKKKVVVSGYVCFFLLVAAIITVAITVYGAVDEKSGGNRTTIAVVMFFVVIVLSVVCTLSDVVRRKIMVDRPVRLILDATEKIAKGDFSVRLSPSHAYEKYDDYDLIMENLNLMAEELGKSEMLKSDFISNVSHELKTPLAVIQNYISLLQGSPDLEMREKCVRTVLQASARLNRLIRDILSLNKLENQRILPPYERIRLDEMLAEAVLRFETSLDEKKLSVDCDLDEIEIFSSRGHLELVFDNLLSNAVKFSEAGGKIGVSLKRTEKEIVVKVSDTGCGISAETGKRIFDKFYQGDSSHSQEGNGLGLALVKRVIDVLGGTISVESEVGKGSVFTVALKNG